MVVQSRGRKDFLISYTGSDLPWAEWIGWELEADGYTVVLQAWDIRPGQNLTIAMRRAIAQTDRTIGVVSPRYINASSTTPDWVAFVGEDPSGQDRTFVPVRVELCQPPPVMERLPPIELTGLDEPSARSALLEGVRSGQANPPAPPSFPAEVRPAVARPRFPTALPPIWTVPYQRYPDRFVGRTDLLALLEERLGNQAVAVQQAVSGLGGVGKSQLAVEYAYRYRSRYETVCWVRAGGAGPLVADYAALERHLGLPRTERTHQGLVLASVKRWFEANDRWLLIFDDAGAPDFLVGEGPGFQTMRDFLPLQAQGHVLLTTRMENWEAFAAVARVDVLAPDEAETFLLRLTGSADSVSARAIATALAYLPLALEQARAYIAAVNISLSAYLDRLSRFSDPSMTSMPPDYEGKVALTYKVSIDRLAQESPSAVELLEVFAFLAPEDIPRDEWFLEPMSGLSPALDPIARDFRSRDRAVGELRRYSLLRTSWSSGISMHRVVQAAIRQLLGNDAKAERIAVAVRLVDRLFPIDVSDVAGWPLCDRLVEHALASVQHAYEHGGDLTLAGDLVERVLTYLFIRARYVEAHKHSDLALQIVEAAHGVEAPDCARVLLNHGEVYYELGDLHAARLKMEVAMAVGDRAGGLDNATRVRLLSSLGLVLLELGRLPEAKHLQEQALSVADHDSDIDQVLTARVHSNLGVVHFELGNREQARACQERALDLLPKQDNGSATHIIRRRLAVVLYDFGGFTEPRENLEKAVAYFNDALGEDHPEVAKTLHHLGFVMWDLGELDTARKYFERALSIFTETYRRSHPAVARTLTGLGMVLQDQGLLDEALNLQLTGVEMFEQLLGADHFEVGRANDKLGFVLRNLNRRLEARTKLETAVDILGRAFGPTHQELAITLSNLGLVLQELGDFDAALGRHRQAIDIFQAFYPDDHPHRHLAYSRLAMVYHHNRDFDNAKRILEAAIYVFRTKKLPDHPDVARAMEKLATVLNDMGDLDGAAANFEGALRIFRRKLGPDHPRTKISADRLAQFRATIRGSGPGVPN